MDNPPTQTCQPSELSSSMYASYVLIPFCLNSLLVAPKCTTNQRRQQKIRMFVRLFATNEIFSNVRSIVRKIVFERTNERTHTKFGSLSSTDTHWIHRKKTHFVFSLNEMWKKNFNIIKTKKRFFASKMIILPLNKSWELISDIYSRLLWWYLNFFFISFKYLQIHKAA